MTGCGGGAGLRIPLGTDFAGTGDEVRSVTCNSPGCGVADLLQPLSSTLGVEDRLMGFRPSVCDEDEPRRGLSGESGCGAEGLRRGFNPFGCGVSGLRHGAIGDRGEDELSLSEDQSFPITDVSVVEM